MKKQYCVLFTDPQDLVTKLLITAGSLEAVGGILQVSCGIPVICSWFFVCLRQDLSLWPSELQGSSHLRLWCGDSRCEPPHPASLSLSSQNFLWASGPFGRWSQLRASSPSTICPVGRGWGYFGRSASRAFCPEGSHTCLSYGLEE